MSSLIFFNEHFLTDGKATFIYVHSVPQEVGTWKLIMFKKRIICYSLFVTSKKVDI